MVYGCVNVVLYEYVYLIFFVEEKLGKIILL